jgi:hypothetical protein
LVGIKEKLSDYRYFLTIETIINSKVKLIEGFRLMLGLERTNQQQTRQIYENWLNSYEYNLITDYFKTIQLEDNKNVSIKISEKIEY